MIKLAQHTPFKLNFRGSVTNHHINWITPLAHIHTFNIYKRWFIHMATAPLSHISTPKLILDIGVKSSTLHIVSTHIKQLICTYLPWVPQQSTYLSIRRFIHSRTPIDHRTNINAYRILNMLRLYHIKIER